MRLKQIISIEATELQEIKKYCSEHDLKISALFRIGAKKVMSNG